MTRNRLTVGKVEVVAVSDGGIEFAADDFFPDVPKEAWTPYRGLLGEGHELLLNLGSFVLLSEGKTVLIDAGLGEGQSGPWKGTGGGLIADLERNGIGVGRRGHSHLHAPPPRPRRLEHDARRRRGGAHLPQRPLLGPQGGLGPLRTARQDPAPRLLQRAGEAAWPTWGSWS